MYRAKKDEHLGLKFGVSVPSHNTLTQRPTSPTRDTIEESPFSIYILFSSL